ncbi:DUF7681 family protein [Citreimonas salinaria]|uniref:Acb2/Tad1 hairpin domain-containing protein n=1 Tax=Citreimonas salinaria TaxID=321339 RepID=A0A1H3KTC1_9RHOB|nr:hypothetical protein [Citreimonas salinaria]SDY55219.1 hypothetical protein SAMN05444340_11089 [Citreimonas salinaria]
MGLDLREDVSRRIDAALEGMAIERGMTLADLKAAARIVAMAPTELGQAQAQALAEIQAMFLAVLHEMGGTDPDGDRFATRDLALAATNMQQAVMWAVEHITR